MFWFYDTGILISVKKVYKRVRSWASVGLALNPLSNHARLIYRPDVLCDKLVTLGLDRLII